MKNRHLDKRQAVLNAALKLFTEYGFHGTPTSKIASEAGVATGTLFHYFNTKEELINQLYLEIKQDLKTTLSAELSNERTLRGKFRRMLHNFIAWSLKYPEKIRFFMQFTTSPYITNITREEAVQHLRFLFDFIEEGKQAEVLKDIPSELLFDITTGMSNVLATHFLHHPDKFQEDAYRDLAFDVCWDSIKR